MAETPKEPENWPNHPTWPINYYSDPDEYERRLALARELAEDPSEIDNLDHRIDHYSDPDEYERIFGPTFNTPAGQADVEHRPPSVQPEAPDMHTPEGHSGQA
ncbi:hypothetical protein ACFQV2_06005 [Actinokineospora soli]|uniref:Uncharacterized protein n=1 Tax=Actinokineospora soli TaxID=1048753 RepID=A0ABW2THI8_9PSEU